MWRDSLTVKPGTVQVVVKEPIDVTQWDPEQMRERVAEVRQMYADTLARWPQGPATVSGVATQAHSPGEVDVANLTGGDLEPIPVEGIGTAYLAVDGEYHTLLFALEGSFLSLQLSFVITFG